MADSEMPARGPRIALLLKLLTGIACAAPLAWLYWAWQAGELGFHPAEAIVHFLGRFGLGLLLLTLILGTLAHVLRAPKLLILHPLLGIAAFVYLTLHALSWAGLDMVWEWEFIAMEMVDLRYLQVGLVSLVLLIPLPLTSGRGLSHHWGSTLWHWLHRLGYVAVAAGLLHLWIITRADYALPVIYMVGFAAVIALRLLTPLWHTVRAR
ncbi:ferric reductase-like transmembrane domain-containing protein [Aquisalimonas sp.]|uniref:ferric reductase-like transmembrane domain-containing protein n=1 Tax=Aquisalimonas sp. TaxID=1872621 RepID=UPI0025C0A49B|nr:ferric reductase-like transmembrane domain-containing protein [Aquisalimonas sp.]